MTSVHAAPLPDHALLQRHARDGHYTDCFAIELASRVSHAQYVAAFYTTGLFRLERWVLRWAIARPSTDDEAWRLARGELERFSAWRVEARAADQVLLRDEFTQRTCSWLMVETLPAGSRLYFGSAVIREPDGRMGGRFSALLGFHTLYSRLLLASAAKRVAGVARSHA